jgi:hypothetical protein
MPAKLGATKGVEGFIGVFLSFFGIPAFLSLIVSVWHQHKWPGVQPPGQTCLVCWNDGHVGLVIRDRRAKRTAANIESQGERPAG